MEDKIDKARELFEMLESNSSDSASEIARRAFCIQERLAQIID